MCDPMSGIITRESVLWDEWSDSHSKILEKAGINDDSPVPDFVKFELIPPHRDYSLPLEKWEYREDQGFLPVWYNRKNAEAEARKVLPLWAKTHLITEDGKEIDLSSVDNPSIVELAKNVTITGQKDGEIRFSGSSSGTSKNQKGGMVWFRDNSSGTSKNQQGGMVWFRDNSSGTSKNQQGGMVWFRDNSSGTSERQQGGTVVFLDNSTGVSEDQQGGKVSLWGRSAVANIKAIGGAVCDHR